MSIILQVFAGIALGYLAATLAESFLHRAILHAGSRMRRYWKRHPLLCTPFLRAYYCHHVVHHGLTFKKNHVTQFQDEQERGRLDSRLPIRWARLLREEQYGLTLRGSGLLMFVLPVVPLLPLIYFLCGTWVTIGAAIPLLIIYPCMSMVIHPVLHLPHEAACSSASWIFVRLLKTPYMQAVMRNHYLHHQYGDCNFNLLLGGDYLLGVHRPPLPEDVRRMSELGILVEHNVCAGSLKTDQAQSLPST